METISEAPRSVPVAGHFDLCVIGGSCTGLFAAVAAARRGLSVAIVEALAYFGGTATASLVCVWHSHMDARFEKQIIAGLSMETVERLERQNAVQRRTGSADVGFVFNPAELALELDELALEAKIRPFLHTRFVAPVGEGGRVTHAIIEDKTGRRAIAAKMFVDATGDADLIHRAGLPCYKPDHLQPPTACFFIEGLGRLKGNDPQFTLRNTVFDPKFPEALRPGFLWDAGLPTRADVRMVAGTRVHGADCSDADQLTAAEIEGRKQIRQIRTILRKHVPGGESTSVLALPARIGIRHSRQAQCLHTLTEGEVLSGTRFDDAIANGSYRVDVHADAGEGLVFRYLDGREVTIFADGSRTHGRWRPEGGEEPTFYQVPYRSIVPRGSVNVLAAGRCVDADEGAYGAVRVMVNCNQLGEAAGVAAAVALDQGKGVAEIDVQAVRRLLAKGGAIVL